MYHFISHTIGPADPLHPSPAPHLKVSASSDLIHEVSQVLVPYKAMLQMSHFTSDQPCWRKKNALLRRFALRCGFEGT